MQLWDPMVLEKVLYLTLFLAHPKYEVTKGDILLDGESILELKADERAKKGLFLGFQYPTEVSGVGFSHFLRTSYNALSKAMKGDDREVFITVREFQKYLKENIKSVGLSGRVSF